MKRLDKKINSIPDHVFDRMCRIAIHSICAGAALYFVGMMAAHFWWRMR